MATKKKKAKAKTTYKSSAAKLKEALRAEILNELQNEDARREAELEDQRQVQARAHKKYIEQMYESPDPWVEIQSWADTPQGVKVELEWNDAFVNYLKESGIQGTDEDQIVQKWVTLLLMQISDGMENPEDRSSALE